MIISTLRIAVIVAGIGRSIRLGSLSVYDQARDRRDAHRCLADALRSLPGSNVNITSGNRFMLRKPFRFRYILRYSRVSEDCIFLAVLVVVARSLRSSSRRPKRLGSCGVVTCHRANRSLTKRHSGHARDLFPRRLSA